MSRYLKWLTAAGVTVALLTFGGCIYWNTALAFVDSYELGYRFDKRTGTIKVLPRSGWFSKHMFLEDIHTVDLRPMQVCINANSRVLNCKLVKFNPAGLQLFLEWHGRQNYDQATVGEILKSYAYEGSGKSYPFLIVLRELKNEENDAVSRPAPQLEAAQTPPSK